MTRIAILNALIADGSGDTARKGTLILDGDLIEAVIPDGAGIPGDCSPIDLTGLVVAPGFIDVHSHADNAPLLDEDDISKIMQGVTTEVVGNCGFSLAPLQYQHEDIMREYATRIFPPLDWGWTSMGELFEALDMRGYVTNYAPMVGHHTLRILAMGMENRNPSLGEESAMGRALDESVDAGIFGMSTGLIYPPGVFAGHTEISKLVGRLPSGILYATHMRGEGAQVFQSIEEALAVGEATGRRVQISHLKVAGRYNWGRMQEALDLIDSARARGVDVRQDIYPYTAGSTMLTACLPPWFQEGGNEGVLRRLRDAQAIRELEESLSVISLEWENMVMGAGWEGIVVASTGDHRFEGQSLAEIAIEYDIEPCAALCMVLIDEELQATMTVHQMSEADVTTALSHPQTMIGSDGLPPGTGGKPHPRLYGTFPRILGRFARELGVLSMEEAVRRMSSLPADTFGLHDRGRIAAGMKADLVAFDQRGVQDTATFENPVQTPTGIPWVMVNGSEVVVAGSYAGARRGRRLVRHST
jgi:N-acyl-D-amino-acid deacylase